jgi:hypothetical protein
MKRPALFAALLCLAMPATASTPERAETGEESYLPLSDISVPIVDAGRLDGVLRVSIVLQTYNGEAADQLKEKMPQLHADSLSATAEFARLYASPYSPVDVQRLSEEIAPALRRNNMGIRKVLIVNVSAKEA